MKSYKVLDQQKFTSGEYAIVPIRMEDRYAIMKWRNEQMYHLRQNEILTKENQDEYFNDVISNLFDQEKPNQILFSFLKGDECIGYGALVHINWVDKNAEISFIMNTSLEEDYFELYWINFLELIEEVAFKELGLHKIFTYAYDLRPLLYSALEKSCFALESELKEHCYFNSKFISVKIHSKMNKNNELRFATESDLNLTFGWVNNVSIRAFSFNKQQISLKDHAFWFLSKIENSNCEYYILKVNGICAGSIRFDIEEKQIAKINYLLDPNFTGKGLGTYLLENGIKFLKENRPEINMVYGYVLKENMASIKIFEKLLFEELEKGSKLKYQKRIK
ncbi:GNAT family N-acetyltransferase [Salegentibacter salegens]|uniref:Protein N-acetyltransferase, RimJ/RimL family n=1 Tax=Salegentibacter salegens TaxID=143223 RepID=A0A1M7HCH4_9FLAO|nr:GNAT family N-acetyltransferase [Salegentibacter salegens]PRX43504.1 RimJ/RimL family protein N-acetyltransferase [Salegentibacter salegens]SHM26271.1 Protein N-acetyltransferase, RimJ/RimL family [Salegentibacter salegens]